MKRYYITTAIPYVNAQPHIGFALEIVQADVVARHYRHRANAVRFLTGTDDNSLKNVQAAEAEGMSPQEFVGRNSKLFEDLREPLQLSFDDFIRTSADPRHFPGVERLWRACHEAGDLYKRHYEGLYCVGCEQFYAPDELIDGKCPEHGTVPQKVSEENWFFRLSRYQDHISELITSSRLRIEPESRRNEVLGLLKMGLQDFSVSRSRERARGWGVPVPDDPTQVMYVWYDALGNYITALDYGTNEDDYAQWWVGSDRRIHFIGKGIIRFHAVYWPAMLMSAGEPVPTDIFVHDYLTVDGKKIGKSLGNAIDPTHVVDEYGTDAFRWWLLRDVPKVGDADFTVARLVARANDELANGVGNLVNRVVGMLSRYRDGVVPSAGPVLDGFGDIARELDSLMTELPGAIDDAIADFDFRKATAALVDVVSAGNRYIEHTQPWVLAKAERGGDSDAETRLAGVHLDRALGTLVQCCRLIGDELQPFLPSLAEKVVSRCAGEILTSGEPLYPRLSAADTPRVS